MNDQDVGDLFHPDMIAVGEQWNETDELLRWFDQPEPLVPTLPRKEVTMLAEKQELLAQLRPNAAVAENKALLVDLGKSLNDKIRAEARIRATKTHLEEAKAMTLLNSAIDGKNETQRAAQLTLALRDDPDYHAALRDAGDAQIALDESEAWLELTRRRLDLGKAQLRIIGATLELMAS